MTDVDWREVYDWAGLQVREFITMLYPTTIQILDVGAGQGKYRRLLREYPWVDGCEIWEPTVRRHDLHTLYHHMHVGDVYDLMVILEAGYGDDAETSAYDVMIFGDVIEHLTRERAWVTLQRAYTVCPDVLVVIPYLYPQEPHDDNEYQRHLQDDLTPELMHVEYPELSLVSLETREGRPFKGIYRRRSTECQP